MAFCNLGIKERVNSPKWAVYVLRLVDCSLSSNEDAWFVVKIGIRPTNLPTRRKYWIFACVRFNRVLAFAMTNL